MPQITPIGLDLPLEYVTRVWYTESDTVATTELVMSITADIPEGAAVWQLLSCDVSKATSGGYADVWLSVDGRETERMRVSSIAGDLWRHHFVQHLWLNLPAGRHTFEAWRDPRGCRMRNRMMAVLLLKR